MAKDFKLQQTANNDDISDMDFSEFDSAPVSDLELDWVEAHADELSERFSGDWIAVKGDRVVAHAKNLSDVNKQVEGQGIDDPFFLKIPPRDEQNLPLEL